MNFLNRKMFQTGGSVAYADGTVDRITAQDFANQLANLSDSELFALRNSSDAGQISLTMDLKAILDDVTNRKAIPLTRNLDTPLRSSQSFIEDYGRTAKGVFLPALSGISRQLIPEETLEKRPRLRALADYDSPIYGAGFRGAMEAGMRGGRSEEEFKNILQSSPVDLTSDIEKLLEEERQLDEEVSAVEDPITLTSTPVTGGETLGRSSDIDIARRQIEFEKSMIGRDEFGELLPDDRPDFTSQLPSPERTSPVDLPPAVENEIQNALDELEGMTVPELVPETKPSVTFEKPKIDLQNVDTEITIDDLNRERASKLPPRETSGVFGSDRFLDFIRNVGGELARTGQLGEGLASGAAKAAEERAARDLLQEEEARKQTQAKELLKYEASLEALDAGIMDYKEAQSIGEAEESIDTAIRNFSGSERTLKDLDAVFKDLEDPNAYGVKGWLTQSMTKLAAAAGMSLGDWKDLDPTTRINTTLDVLAQQSVREILGESGKTISNLDRQIVADIFGNLTIFTQPADIKKRLTRTRNNVIDSMEQDRRAIIRGTSYLARTGQTSPQVTEEEQLINKILGIDFNTLREPGSYFASEGIIDTTLRPPT